MKTVFADAAAPEDSAPVTKIASKNLAKLTWQMVKPYKKWLLLIFIAMLVETAMSLAAPWPLKIIIDDVIGHHHLPHWLLWMNKIFPAESKVQFAAIAAISVILIAVIGALAGYVDSYFTESVAQYVANDLRRLVYHHLQQLSLSYYDTHQTGKLLSTITADVSTIQDFASSTLMNIVVDVLTIFFMMGLMLYLNTSFTLVIICLTPFLLFFISRFKKVMKKATHEVRVDQSTMFTVLQQGLESIRTINAFGRQAFEEDHLKKISLQTVGAALKARRVKSMLSPFVTIIVAVCTAVVLWRASDLVLKGALTIGSLTVYLWYMNRFFSPVQDLAKMTTLIAQATVALERIQAILDTGLTIQEKTGAVKPNRLNGDILFDDVSFAYNSGEPVLKHINLEICCGQRIGICGYTGCGKSTLVSLIARFYDATGGKILIDGVDINDYTLDGLRAQVGFVLQDTVLFYGSIRDNIGYGKLDAADEEIIAAAKMANAHEFIAQMPNGYNTLVGERGLTLSGGQRQRIGIARAVMRNAPILVLDEPTAALDTESEILVMNALENLMEGRTVITIAHRLSTICSSDKIVVLNKGSIAEEGTHEELLVKKGIYADLYNMQAQASHKLRKLVAEQ